MNIKIIIGTARQGRYSDKVAKTIAVKLKDLGIEPGIIDTREYISPFTIRPEDADTTSENFKKQIIEAEVLILIVPEYNHSFPGELKILLDRLYLEYENKIVYLVGVSSGVFGGVRGVESLLPILVKFNMNIKYPPLYISNVQKIFNDNDELIDEKQLERINKFIVEINESNKK